MNTSSAEYPAILGGQPVRPAGPPAWPRPNPRVQAAMQQLIESGDWGRYHGPHLPRLRQKLGDYFQVEHVLPCCGGTAAIELALRGAGVGAGDEVILAAYDFKANFQNVLIVGAVPVLVDLDPKTWQLNVDLLEAAISNRTKVILISHLHGGLVDVRKVQQVAQSRGLIVIEDACQCPGAVLYGKRAGTWGDLGVISFGGSKLLTAGRGGAILTNRTDLAERIKRYSFRGNEAYPLSEGQAAVLLPQLNELDEHNEIRRQTVIRICSGLAECKALTPLQLPTETLIPAYYKVGFRYQADRCEGLHRETFIQTLQAEGIAIDSGFRGLHLIHGSRRFRPSGDLPEASVADTDMVTLYHPVLLEGEGAINEIVAAIKKVWRYSAEIKSANQAGSLDPKEHRNDSAPS